MNTVTANALVLISWAAVVALVFAMLSGPFDGRTCETTCFSLLYWGALVLAIVGTLLSLKQCCFNPESGLFSKIGLLLGLGVSAILIGVMVIGLFIA